MTNVIEHMQIMASVCSFLALNTFFGACNGNVIVYPVNASATSFRDRPATFGNVIAQNGLSGGLVIANPINACVPIQGPPRQMEMIGQFFALIEESSCDFSTQVLHAEEANYEAAIIYNRYSDDLKVMDSGKDGQKVSIPSVFVGRFTGLTLKKYTYDTRASVLITAFTGPSLLIYLIPFVIVVGLCFLFMAIFTIIRYYRHRVHVRRSRLTPANLKKIPCKKYKKGDDFDICAICLDDYEEGDKLRVLPCQHVYHCKCVDPWLLEGKRTCPVCKQPVQLERNKRRSACRRSYSSVVSTSADEMNNETGIGDDENDNNVPSERTPLIHGNRGARNTGIHV